MKPDDLLAPRRRLFTPKPRGPGPLLLLFSLLLAGAVALVLSAYVGWILPDGKVMMAFGLVIGVLFPLLLSRRLARRTLRRGVRVFAGIEMALMALFLLVLGGVEGPTDRALSAHGVRPFHTLARILGQAGEREAPVMDAGRGVVDALRRLARRGVRVEEALPMTVAVVGRVEDGKANLLQRPGAGVMVVDLPVSRSGAPPVVGAIIDGQVPADFVFDTGADTTLLTGALARRLGFAFEESTERRPLRTPAGETLAPVIRLSSIQVESARVEDLEVLVCESCRENLLGRDFQRHFQVEIDTSRGHLRLHRR